MPSETSDGYYASIYLIIFDPPDFFDEVTPVLSDDAHARIADQLAERVAELEAELARERERK